MRDFVHEQDGNAMSGQVKTHYSCAELAAMKLAGMPGSDRRMRDLVERESWLFIEEKSRGRVGVTRLYAPPARILKLIEAHRAGGYITARVGDGKQYVITLDLTIGEAAAMLRWLEKRRSLRG
jgi:hypothetical protein